MATKKNRSQSKRRRSGGNPSNYSSLYKGDSSGVSSAPAAPPPEESAPVAAVTAVEWQKEYAYVFRDLRILFLVSLILFAAILVIGFFI